MPKTTHLGECPCGSRQLYNACCGRWHDGPESLAAPHPVDLMRSRYAAFVLGLSDYLLQTWHPDTRPADVDCGPPDIRWLGLEIRRTGTDLHGVQIVEFVARSKHQGRATRQHETSRFERLDGRWYYRDGAVHR